MRSSSRRRSTAALEVLTAETLRPSIDLFFDKITMDQWILITQGSPDDATKMLLADLILEMISSVTSVISTAVEEDPTAKESLVSGLDQSLRRSLSEVLHIPEHADDVSVRCVTDMMKEEVKEGLDAFFSGSPQKSTTLCSLNAMILIVINVMKKFSKRVKKVFKPRKAERRREPEVELEAEGLEAELATETSASSLSKELKDIVSPILEIVPDRDYEVVFSETATEIQALSEDIGTLLDGTKGQKNPLKLCKRKIINFFAKSFLKVWIHRLVGQLRRQHAELRTADGGKATKAIVVAITSWLESDQQNSLVLGFHTATSDESVFTKTVSELIYQGLLADSQSTDAERNREIYADIKKKAWKFESSMNWFLKSLVVKFAAKVNILSPILGDAEDPEAADSSRFPAEEPEISEAEEEPEDQPVGEQEPPEEETEDEAEAEEEEAEAEEEEAEAEEAEAEEAEDEAEAEEEAEEEAEDEAGAEEEGEEEAEASPEREEHLEEDTTSLATEELQDGWELEPVIKFVHFLTEKIINHLHSEAKVVPQYNDQVLNALHANIWHRVWDNVTQLHLTDESFKKMDRTIHKVLCKKGGDPNEVLFTFKYSDSSFVEDCAVAIARKLLKPPKKNIFQRLFWFLG